MLKGLCMTTKSMYCIYVLHSSFKALREQSVKCTRPSGYACQATTYVSRVLLCNTVVVMTCLEQHSLECQTVWAKQRLILFQTHKETSTCKQQQTQLKNAARRFLWQTSYSWLGDKSGWATAAVLFVAQTLDQFSKLWPAICVMTPPV